MLQLVELLTQFSYLTLFIFYSTILKQFPLIILSLSPYYSLEIDDYIIIFKFLKACLNMKNSLLPLQDFFVCYFKINFNLLFNFVRNCLGPEFIGEKNPYTLRIFKKMTSVAHLSRKK